MIYHQRILLDLALSTVTTRARNSRVCALVLDSFQQKHSLKLARPGYRGNSVGMTRNESDHDY